MDESGRCLGDDGVVVRSYGIATFWVKKAQ